MNSDNVNSWQSISNCPLQQNEAFSVSNRPNNAAASTGISQNVSNARASSMSFPYTAYPVAAGENMYGTHQPLTNSIPDIYDSLMVDLNDLHSQQSSLVDPNPSNMNSNISCMYEQNQICAGQNVKGLSYDRTAITGGASVNDIALYDSFWDLGTNDNVTLSNVNSGGAQKTTSNEVGFSHIHGSEINNFVDFGGSTNMSHSTQHSGGVSIGNQVEVYPAEIDGSFLSLGIGDCAIPNFGSDLSSQGVTSTSNLPPDLNVPDVFQFSNSSVRRGQNMVDQFSGQNHVRGWTSANSSIGFPYHTVSGANTNQFHTAQKPNITDTQYRFPTSNTGNLAIEGDGHARYANLHTQKGFIAGDMTASPGQFSSSSARLLNPGRTASPGQFSSSSARLLTPGRTASPGQFSSSSARLLNPGRSEPSGFTSEPVKRSWTTSQLASHLPSQGSEGNVQQNISPQSSTLHSFSKLIRNSNRHDTPGQLLSAGDGFSPGVSRSDFYPGRVGVEVGKDAAAQAGIRSLLSQRSRVQFDEHGAPQATPQATANCLLPGGTGTQLTDNRVAYAAEFGSHLNNMPAHVPGRLQPVSADLRGSSFRPGGFQAFPAQLSRDPRGSSYTTGHSQGQIFQLSRDLGAPSSTTGQAMPMAQNYGISQAAKLLGEASLKRSAVRLTPTAPRVQRRKIQPLIPPSNSSSQQIAPGTASVPLTFARIPPSIASAQQIAPRVAAPATVAHIKWEGANETPQPSGEKCMICKRDLSFTPEGPVYQPAIAPPVAVLPCSHTFHDHCLQNITPPDQSKNPPCIPCAIGDI